MLTGLDVLVSERFARWKGQRLGVLSHQASVARDLGHIVDHMLAAGCDVKKLFGPQHGPWGHTQDNMVEWSGYVDPRTGLPTFSLYGKHREPTPEMLEGIDRLVIDLQDVGCRVYTFVWTLALCLKACETAGLPVSVLDRPNPIGSVQEGPVLEPGFESFVGLHPLPMRHGLSIGRLASLLRDRNFPEVELEMVLVQGLSVNAYGDESDWTWVSPSPNMPTVDTAVVYPGAVLFEGTNLSEGRGTTRPFETIGAPWLDGHKLSEVLNSVRLPGVHFRPVCFQPTFQKHAGEVCEGVFVHVLDRSIFHPVLTGIAVLQRCARLDPGRFKWKEPPYEYEETLLPIDILAGNSWVRKEIEEQSPLNDISARMASELELWRSSAPRVEEPLGG